MSAPRTEAPAGVSIDEIESDSVVAVSFWTEQHLASDLLESDIAVSGLVVASSVYYLAERVVDACELLAKAIQDSRNGGEQ